MPEPIAPATCQYSKEGHADCAIRSARADTDTRRAAAACLDRLITQRLAPRGRAVSPLGAMRAAADCLERDAATAERVWVVRADAREPSADAGAHRRISAWPLRFLDARKRFEKPLLYLLHARATDRLRLASVETIDRGIFVNDAETVASSTERRDARCPALAGREPRVHAVRSGVGP